MFTPNCERGTVNPSFGSASARVAAAKRRSVGVFDSGVKRSPFLLSGRSTPQNRSLQASQFTESSGQHLVESYGTPLPALVLETLTFSDSNTEMSAVLSASGWAWLVCGRRLHVWKYRQDEARKTSPHLLRELTLPPSDLAHRAQLVVCFPSVDGGQVPSCIAVSPEGFVRYWPNIAHEGSYSEVSTELQGQECESLLFLGASLGCLLATTTSSTLLIQPGGSVVGAQQGIQTRHLKVPEGILGGISRRVSSLVFGSMPTQVPEARLVRVLSLAGGGLKEKNIVVLSAHTLQKWCVMQGDVDRLLYEFNVEKLVRDCFVAHVWGLGNVVPSELCIWLIDMQPNPKDTSSVVILTAAMNSKISKELVYALATLDTSSTAPPTIVSNFIILKHSDYYQESSEHVLLAQRFLLCGNTAFVYSKNSVLCVSATGDGENGSTIDFSHSSDYILGVGKCQGQPLFFTTNRHIVSISVNQATLLDESINEEMSQLNDSMNMSVGLEAISRSSSATERLQAAFLHFNKGNFTQAQLLLEDLFPTNDNSRLDICVLQLSLNILDDRPATDPRWAETASSAMAVSSVSMIIEKQLKDKCTAHRYFINFLMHNVIGLWQRLSSTHFKGRACDTRLQLIEHGERLSFAIAAREEHKNALTQPLIDTAIKHILCDWGEVTMGRLTQSDLFYRRVSQVDDLVWGLLRAQEDILSVDMMPRDAPSSIYSVNAIMLTLLHCIKDSKSRLYQVSVLPKVSEATVEHVPWTASEGPRGIRTLLTGQHQVTVEIGLSRSENAATRAKLFTQMVDIVDEILTGYQIQLLSLAEFSDESHQTLKTTYERVRYNLIHSLVKNEQFDQSLILAEKFCDFRTLVEICHKIDDQERLNNYMMQFEAEGFADFVFRWHLETGKRGQLFSQGVGSSGKDFARFLQDYASLAWVNHIQTGNFAAAHTTLHNLAKEETTFFARKKTLVSLSKLCALAASEEHPDGERLINDDLKTEENLLWYQQDLPETVLKAHSFDVETMRVMKPEELIQLYISEDNISANEYDFKKALELLIFLDPNEIGELKRDIWVSAVTRNSWQHMDLENPVEALSETVFFKTVDLVATDASCNPAEILVPLKVLLSSDQLSQLRHDSSFLFLMNAGYEKIQELGFL